MRRRDVECVAQFVRSLEAVDLEAEALALVKIALLEGTACGVRMRAETKHLSRRPACVRTTRNGRRSPV